MSGEKIITGLQEAVEDAKVRASAWQVINDLFERFGLPHPPTRLRDELAASLISYRAAEARAETAEAEVSRLQASLRVKDEALEPFAKALKRIESWGGDLHDGQQIGPAVNLYVGDLRRAAQARGGPNEPTP